MSSDSSSDSSSGSSPIKKEDNKTTTVELVSATARVHTAIVPYSVVEITVSVIKEDEKGAFTAEYTRMMPVKSLFPELQPG